MNVKLMGKYVVWNAHGEFIFETNDSLDLIKKMMAYQKENPHITYKYTSSFLVLTNGIGTKDYSAMKITQTDPIDFKDFILSDSALNSKPTRDSFIDGKWLIFSQFDKLELVLMKEVRNFRLVNLFMLFRQEGNYLIRYFKDGYPVGSLKEYVNNKLRVEILYIDSLNFEVYEKVYDKNGDVHIYMDWINGFLYQYYPNKSINIKVKLNKYGKYIMPFFIYNNKGELTETLERLDQDPFDWDPW